MYGTDIFGKIRLKPFKSWDGILRRPLSLSLNERYKLLRDKFACYGCLIPGHLAIECVKRDSCTYKSCDRLHHHTLHPPEENIQNNSFSSSNDSNMCLLQIMSVPVKSRKMGNINIAWV